MSFVAVGWQVYEIHRDPLDLGIVGLAMFLPLPLLALPAGHLADRYPRRTILVAAIAIDAVVAVGLLLVTRSGALATIGSELHFTWNGVRQTVDGTLATVRLVAARGNQFLKFGSEIVPPFSLLLHPKGVELA